jgi:hypothetical protein
MDKIFLIEEMNQVEKTLARRLALSGAIPYRWLEQ